MTTKFQKLIEPGQIGRVKIKNRMVKPAQSMHFATQEGYVSETNLTHYEMIANSGVGLINVEMAAVGFPSGYPSFKDLRLDDDKFIPGLAKLADIIHRCGATPFLQINHAGPSQPAIQGVIPKSPSSLSGDELPRTNYGPTTELTIAEIEDIIERFARTAERARKAGYDGVELHGGHNYLIASFLSSAWNKRTDRYGGSLENRARFACDIIRAIKQRVGNDFAVGIRVNGAEYGTEGRSTPGSTSQEVQTMCQMIQKAGADDIHVTAVGFGPYYDVLWMPEQMFYPEPPKPLGEGLDGSRHGAGGLTLLSARIKKVVSIPVIAVGRLDPVLAEKVLQEGKADFVAMGRALMADPQIARKVLEGREEDIAPCTRCSMCFDNYRRGNPVVCRINAAYGKEKEYVIKPAETKKKIMVVGGGPAGMEAARVAALRGHQVFLYDKAHWLGGSLPVVAMVKGTEVEDLISFIRYFKTQLRKLGVQVTLGKEVNAELVKEVSPDVLLLAAGGTAVIPDIRGINSKLVMSQGVLHQKVKPFLRIAGPKVLRWLTKFYLPVGKRVVIIGGGIHGMEVAEFLVKRGRKVTVTEASNELGAGLPDRTNRRLQAWLTEHQCEFLSEVKYEEITDKGLTLLDKDGKKRNIEADTVLTALPLKPNAGLLDSLKGSAPELRVIGDARDPQLILEAVADGFKTALTI